MAHDRREGLMEKDRRIERAVTAHRQQVDADTDGTARVGNGRAYQVRHCEFTSLRRITTHQGARLGVRVIVIRIADARGFRCGAWIENYSRETIGHSPSLIHSTLGYRRFGVIQG